MQRDGRSLAFLRAEEKFREVLAGAGSNPPVLTRIHCDTDLYHNRLMFGATFAHNSVYSGPPLSDEIQPSSVTYVRWEVDRFELEECAPHPMRRLSEAADYLKSEYRSLYFRMYEDHLMESELRPRREAVDKLVRYAVDPHIVQRAWEEYRQFESHVRNNHAYVDYSVNHLVGPIPYDPPSQQSRRMLDDMARRIEAQTYQAFMGDAARERERARHEESYWRAFVGLTEQLFSGEVGTPAAQAKGLELLKSWLTPEQAASYEKTKSFEVVGSDTKKRYRIKHGRQMNIELLDAKGNRKCGYCFLPHGALVAGDVMLAQKIALETFESKALKVANKFH